MSSLDKCRVSVASLASVRTVERYLGGRRTRPAIAAAIDRALRELGFGHLVPGATMPAEVSPAA